VLVVVQPEVGINQEENNGQEIIVEKINEQKTEIWVRISRLFEKIDRKFAVSIITYKNVRSYIDDKSFK